MLALVTRPREDSEAVARALETRGLTVMIEPLLDIEPATGTSVDGGGIQGILVTSGNGIRALARLLPDRSLPVWAVGESSARIARELGYATVTSADGDVEALAALVIERVDPAGGALLHPAGTVTAGDLAGRLAARGFDIRRQTLYRATTATALSPGLVAAMTGGTIDLALFFSPRTAATFARLILAAGQAATLAGTVGYALSANVETELAGLPWRALRRAEQPTQAALLAVIDHDLERGFIR